jgi:hypothetical protein
MKQMIILIALMSISRIVLAKGDGDFASGDGTQGSPYLITTAVQLDSVRGNLAAAPGYTYFKLMNDIDLKVFGETNNWRPINTNGARMDFDGNGHVIKNMHIATGTAGSPNYQSFAGFIQGQIRNLGLVNVYVDCPAVGGIGAFAGYAGSGTPGNSAFNTGSIVNCFATGYVSGGGGTVGGIVGTVGRPANDGTPSYIKNCYFSGELYNVYKGSSATVRTGGIAGLAFANTATATANATPAVENCFATGYYHAYKGRVGGLVGETELQILNSVTYADLSTETETATEHLGLVTGYCITAGRWGNVGNCWAYSGAKMKKGSTMLAPSRFDNPESGTTAPVDGLLKDATALSSALNYYTDLCFPMAGEGAVWSQMLRESKYPQLIWVASRTDAVAIDGLSNPPAFSTDLDRLNAPSNVPDVFSAGNLLIFRGIKERMEVSVYDVKGVLLKSFEQEGDGAAIVVSDPGSLLIVRLAGLSGKVYLKKVIRQ